jgi:hypothetical protein
MSIYFIVHDSKYLKIGFFHISIFIILNIDNYTNKSELSIGISTHCITKLLINIDNFVHFS